ncbi:hypothetical protein C8J35_1212 [Rhizobium sp. PP-F2F-G38]|nr:hypothetical protein C8J35_1212 [Rhizobium sp. PP-F2F-G38]
MTYRGSLRNVSILRTMITALFLIVILMLSAQIFKDSQSSSGFISFTGKTEFVALTLPTTESEFHWSLTGAYICRAPDIPPPENELLSNGIHPGPDLCIGPHGKSNRIPMALPDGVSLSVVGETTLEVSVDDPPYKVGGESFARGKPPNHVIIIKRADPLETGSCTASIGGAAILSNGTKMVELWEDAEIHIPVDERTVMPFVGNVTVGQPNSSNTPDQLRSGSVAVYRQVSDWFHLGLGTSGAQLVRETSLFSGDVVKFQDDICLARTSGFLKAGEDDQGGFISVVASMQSKDGRATIARATPGSSGGVGEIDVQLQLADAFLSHPYIVLLGTFLSLFILIKEGSEFIFDGGKSLGTGVEGSNPSPIERYPWNIGSRGYELNYSTSWPRSWPSTPSRSPNESSQ